MSLFHQSTPILMPPRFALPLYKGEGANGSNEQSGLMRKAEKNEEKIYFQHLG